MRNRLLMWIVSLTLFAGARVVCVVQATSTGFLVTHDVSINAPPAQVYDALVGHVGAWWNPQHTYSGDAKNLSIDARPGGCFCERLTDAGGVEHLRVVFIRPRQILRMAGALGPLQASGVAGSLTMQLTDAQGSTRVQLSYSVGGFIEGGFEKIAPAVDGMLREQLQRLRLFVETGKPT